MITDEETYIEIVNGLFELISNGMWCSLEFDILSERADTLWPLLSKESKVLANEIEKKFWSKNSHLIGEDSMYIDDPTEGIILNDNYVRKNNE